MLALAGVALIDVVAVDPVGVAVVEVVDVVLVHDRRVPAVGTVGVVGVRLGGVVAHGVPFVWWC